MRWPFLTSSLSKPIIVNSSTLWRIESMAVEFWWRQKQDWYFSMLFQRFQKFLLLSIHFSFDSSLFFLFSFRFTFPFFPFLFSSHSSLFVLLFSFFTLFVLLFPFLTPMRLIVRLLSLLNWILTFWSFKVRNASVSMTLCCHTQFWWHVSDRTYNRLVRSFLTFAS